MAKINVEQFAGELGLPVGLLLEQLQAAGVVKQKEVDPISEADKAQLLEHLRNTHGAGGEKSKKITLTRRETTEIKKSDSTGRARTIQVEVRKKRVIAPPAAIERVEPVEVQAPEPAPVEVVETPAAPIAKSAPPASPKKINEQQLALREQEARGQAELEIGRAHV